MSGNAHTEKAWKAEINNDTCSLCEICVNHCASHALISRRANGKLELLFDSHHCDGCLGHTFCQENCPEDAIQLSRVPAEDLPDEPVSLVVGEMAVCQDCGNEFMPERKLATLLEQNKIAPKQVQRYCPGCRRNHLIDGYLKLTDQA